MSKKQLEIRKMLAEDMKAAVSFSPENVKSICFVKDQIGRDGQCYQILQNCNGKMNDLVFKIKGDISYESDFAVTPQSCASGGGLSANSLDRYRVRVTLSEETGIAALSAKKAILKSFDRANGPEFVALKTRMRQDKSHWEKNSIQPEFPALYEAANVLFSAQRFVFSNW